MVIVEGTSMAWASAGRSAGRRIAPITAAMMRGIRGRGIRLLACQGRFLEHFEDEQEAKGYADEDTDDIENDLEIVLNEGEKGDEHLGNDGAEV
jgi:hypothetical protein